MFEKKFSILLREVLFQGFFRLDRLHIQHERFNGEQTRIFTREVFHTVDKVMGVLLFDPQHDKIVLVEQFRSAPALAGENPWLTQIVLGMVDSAETPEQTARREALEEAGCEIQDLMPIGDFYASPGGFAERSYLYIGRVAAPADGILAGLEHEDEDIRVHVLDATKAISMLFSNQIRDAHTLIAMQWFATRHTELRRKWLISEVGTPII